MIKLILSRTDRGGGGGGGGDCCISYAAYRLFVFYFYSRNARGWGVLDETLCFIIVGQLNCHRHVCIDLLVLAPPPHTQTCTHTSLCVQGVPTIKY